MKIFFEPSLFHVLKFLIIKVVVIYDLDPAWGNFEKRDARVSNKTLYESLKHEGIEAYLEELTNPDLDKILDRHDPDETIVFNLCESLPGQSASERQVVEILERRGFTYTGNTPDVIDLSYDKQKVKEVLTAFNIDVPYGQILSPDEAAGWNLFPAIVKPSREHCSLTITEESVVFDNASLEEQILLVNNELRQPAIVEDFIDGREFHVSVWNNDQPEMLPPAEMDFSAFHEVRERLCTYDSKFIPGSRHYEKIQTLIPAPLTRQQSRVLEEIALTAWKVFQCRDYARFDFRLREDRFYLLDVNPNNDISFDTSFAMAVEQKKYTYSGVVKRIAMMAAERHPVFMDNMPA